MTEREKYQHWLARAEDADVRQQLEAMAGQEREIRDSFYRELAFGTGGLRGVLGAGTNRMNVYTVAKATQGLARYLKRNYPAPRVVIGYDSRRQSREFARRAAEIFAGNDISVEIWPTLTPVPTVSFGVRQRKAQAGVMITASHNPAKYNGYKVFGEDGCQITAQAAEEIQKEILACDPFSCRQVDFDTGISRGMIGYMPPEVMEAFLNAVRSQSRLYGDPCRLDLKIVYTPLNGAGLVPVTRILKETGFSQVSVVAEQAQPDGNFPTCPYPNPEIREAMELGLQYGEKTGADLLLATDPDCDRVGIAVRNQEGKLVLLSGNEVGVLLLDYVCAQRKKHNDMPEHPVFIKTIVTTEQASQVAETYGVEVRNVLTGFKYIGEQIGVLEQVHRERDFILAFEESYGYLSGSYVRDKDGVLGAMLICEMAGFYASSGITLAQKLEELQKRYGYRLNTLSSYAFEGAQGFEKMENIMTRFREHFPESYVQKLDYAQGVDGLPKSNVLKLILEDASTVVIRPSGTEPKLKLYLSVKADGRQAAVCRERQLKQKLEKCIQD